MSNVFERRQRTLLRRVEEKRSATTAERFAILIPAACEPHWGHFRQDEQFFYLTGLTEPGAVLVLLSDGSSTLFVPRYEGMRARWVASEITPLSYDIAAAAGVEKIEYLGDRVQSYSFTPEGVHTEYRHLFEQVQPFLGGRGSAYFSYPFTPYKERSADSIIGVLSSLLFIATVDIKTCAPILADMRRTKDDSEIAAIRRAIAITRQAQSVAADMIVPGVLECEVQAALESVYTVHNVLPAFESIVATGRSATVLHYTDHTATIAPGDCVVVDIGASWGGYASDITRTHEAGGAPLSERARTYKRWVLECQEYIASIARPGMYLRSREHHELSLQHLSQAFFAERGVEKLYPHGIGHYVGLETHDVGSYATPLRPGDVITIEPGLYDSELGVGIRIEDNYLVTEDGVVSLSSEIEAR